MSTVDLWRNQGVVWAVVDQAEAWFCYWLDPLGKYFQILRPVVLDLGDNILDEVDSSQVLSVVKLEVPHC